MTNRDATPRWPEGTGQWNRIRTVIVAGDEEHRRRLSEDLRDDTVVVAAPLEMISHLENEDSMVLTVILAGSGGSAADRELASFLDEAYPWVRVVDGRRALEREPAVFPRFA